MKVRDITCISDLYYVIGRWFTLVMVLIAFAFVPFALDVLDSAVSFFMCAGIAFVGVAADYRDKTIYPVHYISAMISGACSIVWVWCAEPMCLLWLLWCAIIAVCDKRRWLLWCEVGCFLSVIAAGL